MSEPTGPADTSPEAGFEPYPDIELRPLVVDQPDWIDLSGLVCEGLIGVYEWERYSPQKLVIDLRIWYAMKQPGASDNVADAVDYAQVAARVAGVVRASEFRLLEALAVSVASHVLAGFELVGAVRVTVHKPEVVLGLEFGDVAVSVTRARA